MLWTTPAAAAGRLWSKFATSWWTARDRRWYAKPVMVSGLEEMHDLASVAPLRSLGRSFRSTRAGHESIMGSSAIGHETPVWFSFDASEGAGPMPRLSPSGPSTFVWPAHSELSATGLFWLSGKRRHVFCEYLCLALLWRSYDFWCDVLIHVDPHNVWISCFRTNQVVALV